MPNTNSKMNPKPTLPNGTEFGKSLTAVLGDAELVQELVQQSARELISVNVGLAKELEQVADPSGVRRALEKSQAVESKVQVAADKLAVVNMALEAEVGARHALEAQLLTVTQDDEAARHASFHDPLTGLPNRALFENRLEHGLAQAKRHGRTLAVMFLDLDDFKKINDFHGHAVGDAVLQTIADRMKEKTRVDDTLCRLAGDEFLYLMTEIESDQDVIVIAEKIAGAICRPCQLSVGQVVVNPSIGISLFPKNGTTVEALIDNADKAMYKAKQSKSVYVFAD
jgi:diguanylate cyclase (GGDEF)-like protein